MSENAAPTEEARSEKNISSKHKWRGKLFSGEGNYGRGVQNIESTDDDIASFLGTTARPEARYQPATPNSRGDTAQDARRSSIQSPQPEIVDHYRRPKPKQYKGLHVTFTAAAPDVIGEGGEEAETPAREVSKFYQQSIAHVRSKAQESSLGSGSEPPPEVQRHLSGSEAEVLSRPPLLQRTSTGLDEHFLANDIGDQDRDADESIYSVSPNETSKALRQPLHRRQDPHRYTSNSYPEAPRQDSPRQSDEHVESSGRYANPIGRGRSHSTNSSAVVTSPEPVTGNIVNHRSSPQVAVNYEEASSSSRNFSSKASVSQSPPEQADKHTEAKHQANPEPSAESKSSSFRNLAKSIGEDSLEDFDSRVRRFNDIFRLGVSARTDMMKVPFVQWIRTATWWFLTGRTGLESAIRGEASSTERANAAPHEEPIATLKQAHVNLAKAWWIIKEITPNHPEIRRFGRSGMTSLIAIIKSVGNQELAELVEVHTIILSNMRALTMSMKRNGRLPPHELEIQRLQLQILPKSPAISQDIAQLVLNNIHGASTARGWHVTEPLFPILVGDTERHFSFCRLFVEASLESRDGARQLLHLPCVVSVLRERSDWGVKATIASHDGQVNIVIQPSGHSGLTWKEVHWKVPSQMIHVDLAENIELRLHFTEKDFRSLWGIYNYTRRVQKEHTPSQSEEIIFERHLDKFQCDDPPNFPSDIVSDCRLRLFEKKSVASDGSGQRSIHDGYRLTIITPPGVKTLSSVTYQLGKDSPMLFSYQHSREGPKLVLRVSPSVRLSPSFRETPDREVFRSLLCGTSIAKEDYAYDSVALRDFSIEDIHANDDPKIPDKQFNPKTLVWNKLRVVNRGPPLYGHNALSTVRAEHLRIMVECDFGTLTDRINLGPGDLQMRLSIDNSNEIKLLRPPQPDMTCSFIDGQIPKEELDSVCQSLQKMATSKTVRTYHFRSLSALHSFQSMVTGFKVLFDGLTSNFAISRRRKGIPLHKQWEATSARLQVIKQDNLFQLIVFFKYFSHGACMNFVLKVTDVFEIFGKSGIFFLRIADAKFAMPKGEEDLTREFVCIDMPEYPGEHDDITIGFDNEQDRDRFAETLPAPVSKLSRMASLRR